MLGRVKIIFAVVILLLSVIPSHSQILRGTLFDCITNKSVEDAILTATNKNTKVHFSSELSDAYGNFILPLIPGVETSVVVRYNDTTLTLSSSGADVILDSLLLTPSEEPLLLNEMTVVARPYSIRRATDRLVTYSGLNHTFRGISTDGFRH